MKLLSLMVLTCLLPVAGFAHPKGVYTAQFEDPTNGMPCRPLTLYGWHRQANGIYSLPGKYNGHAFTLMMGSRECSLVEGFVPADNEEMLLFVQVTLNNSCEFPTEFQVALVKRNDVRGPMYDSAVCQRLQ